MKKILIPYDFSENAESILNYGSGLAKDIEAGIVLLHVVPYPVIVPEAGLPAFSYDDIKDDTLKELEKVAKNLKTKFSSITSVDYFSEMGDVTESIVQYCDTHPIEFVVMGINAYDKKLLKSIMGSNAVSTAHKTKCSVIVIPPGTVYKTPKNIALAEDPNQPDPAFIEKAKHLNRLFSAELQILHVVPENHHFPPSEVVMDNFFERKSEKQPHKLFIITEKKVSEGLLGMLKNKLTDMVIIEPKEHGFFYKLFHESVSTELAFSSPVPVMMIHS